MNVKTMLFGAAFALATGLGIGLSTSAWAVDPVCRSDCAEQRQSCYAFSCGGLSSQQCSALCNGRYNLCISKC
jgi:hypothetical protein